VLFRQEAQGIRGQNCWEFALEHTNVFQGATKIWKTGDTATHFQNYSMVHWESNVKSRYNISWETVLLCPRHASNPCDPRGGLVKKVTFKAQSSGVFTTTDQFVACMEEYHDRGGDFTFCCAPPSDVEYHPDFFPDFKSKGKKIRMPTVNKVPVPGIRQMTMLKYSFVNEAGEEAYEPGIAIVRKHAQSEHFYLHDTRKRPEWKAACHTCQQHFLRPIRKDQPGHATPRWYSSFCVATKYALF
jgi:hypothetical protein